MRPSAWFGNPKAKVPASHPENCSEIQPWCSEVLVSGGVKYSEQEDSSGETMLHSDQSNGGFPELPGHQSNGSHPGLLEQ